MGAIKDSKKIYNFCGVRMKYDLKEIAFSILAGISTWMSDAFPDELFSPAKYSLIVE